MIQVKVELLDAVLRQAEELARAENVPLEQFLGTALSHAIGHWHREGVRPAPRPEMTRKAFLSALDRALSSGGPRAYQFRGEPEGSEG